MFSRDRNAPAKGGKAGPPGLSFIGPEVVVSGHITTSAQLHVDGQVEGDVQCEALCQGETGSIKGNIVTTQARLAGLVDGTVKADVVVLEPSARVTGDVSYQTVSIAAGARIDGRLSRKEGAVADGPPRLVTSQLKPQPGDEAKASELFSRPEGRKAVAAN